MVGPGRSFRKQRGVEPFPDLKQFMLDNRFVPRKSKGHHELKGQNVSEVHGNQIEGHLRLLKVNRILTSGNADGIRAIGPWIRLHRRLIDARFCKGYSDPNVFQHLEKLFHSGLRGT
jgi:hypothetical protein